GLRTGLMEVDRKWGWYFALGLFLTVLGVIASAMAASTTLLSVVVLGWILIAAGVGLFVLSFLTAKWSGFLLGLSAGVLSIIAGIDILNYPVSGAVALTLLIGTILIAAGLYRSVASIVIKFPNWGWSFLSGVVAFVLGAFLLSGLQRTSLFFIGLAVGVDLILHGLSWMMFSTGVHRLAREVGAAGADRRAA